ncbi:hypothetical protein [Novosphingobium sp.]|uniref:hypothetical protein n=1 Tax=Novosphingobium sp. TaxID=1874826 RepID=UPI0031D72EAB
MKAFLAALACLIGLLPGTAAAILPPPRPPVPSMEESRSFGAVTYKEVHPIQDWEHGWTWSPWHKDVTLSVTAGDIAITDDGQLSIRSTHWQCQGSVGVSFYEAVSTTANLEHSLESLVRFCRLPAADWAEWRGEIQAKSADLMAAVAYMKERWVRLTGQSLARCDPTSRPPDRSPGAIIPPPMEESLPPAYCMAPFPMWVQSKEEQEERAHNRPAPSPKPKPRKPAPNRR